VRDVTYLGDTMHYAVATPWEQEVAVRTSIGAREASLQIGARAWLDWDSVSGKVFPA
jgi:putative spermidine/putrescine transport system ATP-binding protein